MEQLDLALRDLARLVPGARDPWWVIGSAAMALHGAEVDVADIDLLMSRSDSARLLRSRGVEPAAGEASARFRSDIFARLPLGGYTAEVMGGFHVHDGADWRQVVPKTRLPVRIGTETLFIPSVQELIEMCRLFGRAKDAERERLLHKLIPAHQ